MSYEIKIGHAFSTLKNLEDNSVHCIVTSPPYWNLRDYTGDSCEWPEIKFTPYPQVEMTVEATECSLGSEETILDFIAHLVLIFREAKRVLHPSGTLWLNIGDTYLRGESEGVAAKNLGGVPWRLAMALVGDGWILRSDIIWHKTRVVPYKARDRCTTNHEYLFQLSKSPKYFFNHEPIREPSVSGKHDRKRMRQGTKRKGGSVLENREGRSISSADTKIGKLYSVGDPDKGRIRRTVWSVCPSNYKGAHFATFPPQLVEPCVLASTADRVCASCGYAHVDNTPSCTCGAASKPSMVLDPFMGAGTTLVVADQLGRDAVGIEISSEYAEQALRRLREEEPLPPANWEEEEEEITEIHFKDLF